LKAKLTKPPQLGARGTCQGTWDDPEWARTYPQLHAFLFDTTWADGSKRDPGSLVLFAQDGVLKACLNDKGVGRVAFVSGVSWDGLIGLVEQGLSDETLDWRQSRK
jgi:hypothetical protein